LSYNIWWVKARLLPNKWRSPETRGNWPQTPLLALTLTSDYNPVLSILRIPAILGEGEVCRDICKSKMKEEGSGKGVVPKHTDFTIWVPEISRAGCWVY
jgi:hypothetical protein